MQIGLASKRTWCETEVAEKFTCPAACVERVWVPTDACPSCFQEPGGQAAISSYSPLILMWLFIVMGTEPRGLHMLNNFCHWDSSQSSNFILKETFFSRQLHVFLKNLLFPTFFFPVHWFVSEVLILIIYWIGCHICPLSDCVSLNLSVNALSSSIKPS